MTSEIIFSIGNFAVSWAQELMEIGAALLVLWFLRLHVLNLCLRLSLTDPHRVLANTGTWLVWTDWLQPLFFSLGCLSLYLGLFGRFWTDTLFPLTKTLDPIWRSRVHAQPETLFATARAASALTLFFGPLVLALLVLALILLASQEPVTYGRAGFRKPKEILSKGKTVAHLLVRRGGRSWRRRVPGGGRHQLVPVGATAITEMMLVRGNTGAGKTSNIFAHILLSSEVPTIYQDQKGTLPASESRPHAAVWGFDSGRPSRSEVWNPLDELRGGDPAVRRLLCEAIIPPHPGDRNEWIHALGRSVLNAILTARDWPDLGSLWASVADQGLGGIADQLPKIWSDLLKDPKVLSWVGIELKTLEVFLDPAVSRITCSPSTTSLHDFQAHGGYVLGDCAVNDYDLARQIFWQMLFGTLRGRGNQSLSLIVLMDEGGDAGRIAKLTSKLNLYRSKGIGVVFGIQNDAFLKEVYQESAATLISSLNRKLTCTHNMDPEFFQGLQGKYSSFTRKVKKGGHTQEEKADLAESTDWAQWHDHYGILLQQQTKLGSLSGIPIDLEQGAKARPTKDLPIPPIQVLPLFVDASDIKTEEVENVRAGYDAWLKEGKPDIGIGSSSALDL